MYDFDSAKNYGEVGEEQILRLFALLLLPTSLDLARPRLSTYTHIHGCFSTNERRGSLFRLPSPSLARPPRSVRPQFHSSID